MASISIRRVVMYFLCFTAILPAAGLARDLQIGGTAPDSALIGPYRGLTGTKGKLVLADGKKLEGLLSVTDSGVVFQKIWRGSNPKPSGPRDFHPWSGIESLRLDSGKPQALPPVTQPPRSAGTGATRPDSAYIRLLMAMPDQDFEVFLRDGTSYKGPVEANWAGLELTDRGAFAAWEQVGSVRAPSRGQSPWLWAAMLSGIATVLFLRSAMSD